MILTSFVMLMFPKKLPARPPISSNVKKTHLLQGDNSIGSFEDSIAKESLSLESSSFLKDNSDVKSPSSTRPCSAEIIFTNPERSLKRPSMLNHPTEDVLSGLIARSVVEEGNSTKLKNKRSIKGEFLVSRIFLE